MDLGATVCIPNGTPRCDQCPISEHCEARKHQLTWLLPVKKSKKARTIEEHTMVLLISGSQVWIRQRPKNQLLAGLWEFLDLPEALSHDDLLDYLSTNGLSAISIDDLGPAKHLFSHREWRMHGWWVTLEHPQPFQDGIWVDVSALSTTYAMAGALSAYRTQLFEKLL